MSDFKLTSIQTMIGHCVRLQVGQSLDTVSDFKSTSSQTIVGHCVGLQVGQSLDTVSDFKSTSSQTIVGHCVGLQVDFKSDNRWTLCRTSSQLQVRQSLRMERPFSGLTGFFHMFFRFLFLKQVRQSLDIVSDFRSDNRWTLCRTSSRLQVRQSLDTLSDFKSTSSQKIVGQCVGLQVGDAEVAHCVRIVGYVLLRFGSANVWLR